MVKLSKKDLVAKVSDKLGITKKDAEEVLDAYLDVFAEELAFGNEVDLFGFGKFEVKTRAARKGINPQTKEEIDIPESKSVSFKAAGALKNKVKGQ